MRWITLILVVIIAVLQYPLWFGKGSWLSVWEVDQKLTVQREMNERLRLRNEALAAEISDLKKGHEAIEERARSELGMIKSNEIFFQVLEDRSASQHSQPTPHAPEKK